MRILITADVFPPEIGGTATHVPSIAEGLAQQGHAVRVLGGTRDPSSVPRTADYSWAVERVDIRRPGWRTTLRLLAHLRWAQVVYDNGLLGLLGGASWWLRKPVVARITGDAFWEQAMEQGWTADEFEPFQRRRYGRVLERLRQRRSQALRRTRAISVPCAYLKGVVSGWGIQPDRIRVIPNAFVPVPEVPAPWPAPVTTPYRLVTAGRLTAWKGIDGLLAAIMPWEDVGLLVAGEGPQRPALESLARRLGIQQRVHFAGWMARPALMGALQVCDLFVYNARFATLPHVLLEAWGAGLPIVATATGGIPELITDRINGRLVPTGDRAVLRQTIREMLDDPLARAALRSAGQVAVQRYSLEAMTAQTIQVLESALA